MNPPPGGVSRPEKILEEIGKIRIGHAPLRHRIMEPPSRGTPAFYDRPAEGGFGICLPSISAGTQTRGGDVRRSIRSEFGNQIFPSFPVFAVATCTTENEVFILQRLPIDICYDELPVYILSGHKNGLPIRAVLRVLAASRKQQNAQAEQGEDAHPYSLRGADEGGRVIK